MSYGCPCFPYTRTDVAYHAFLVTYHPGPLIDGRTPTIRSPEMLNRSKMAQGSRDYHAHGFLQGHAPRTAEHLQWSRPLLEGEGEASYLDGSLSPLSRATSLAFLTDAIHARRGLDSLGCTREKLLDQWRSVRLWSNPSGAWTRPQLSLAWSLPPRSPPPTNRAHRSRC